MWLRTSTCLWLLLALFTTGQAAGTDASTSDDLISELTQLPQCAITCITSTLPITSCKLGDFDCLCNDEAYFATTGDCVLSKCTHKQALTTQAWQAKVCKAPVRDLGPITRQVNIALLVIATPCVIIRFLARWRIQGSNVGWDDWTILGSYMLLIPSTVLLQIMTYKGLGRDIWTVPFNDITAMFKYFYIDQYIYQAVIALTKISIVLLYLRIFPKSVSRPFAYTSWALIAALVAYGGGFIIYCAFQCAPVSYFWTQWDGEHKGKCSNFQLAVYLNSGFNMYVLSSLANIAPENLYPLRGSRLLDLMVFLLPIRKLTAIQVQDKRRKIGIVLTFLIGLFVTICSMVRLKYLSNVSNVTNATYEYTHISLWSGIESEVGVICACMPTIIGPLLNFFRDKFGSSFASLSKSGASKNATSASYVTGDRTVMRLPSGASENDLEMNDRRLKHGGIEQTRETTIYHHPMHEQWSDDDMKLLR